jgi:soluble epoxide hydrolase/lipid-phosphate phosphatase
MPTQPIDPVSDPRITHKTAVLNGYTYQYLYAEPKSGNYTQTVFLVRSSFLIFGD